MRRQDFYRSKIFFQMKKRGENFLFLRKKFSPTTENFHGEFPREKVPCWHNINIDMSNNLTKPYTSSCIQLALCRMSCANCDVAQFLLLLTYFDFFLLSVEFQFSIGLNTAQNRSYRQNRSPFSGSTDQPNYYKATK